MSNNEFDLMSFDDGTFPGSPLQVPNLSEGDIETVREWVDGCSSGLERYISLPKMEAIHNPRPLVYLGIPYSHPDPKVRESRYQAANKATACLIERGFFVYSPITQSHALRLSGCELPTGFDYWEANDKAFLSCCHRLFVLPLDGWKESIGLTVEINFANENHIPITFICDDGSPLGVG